MSLTPDMVQSMTPYQRQQFMLQMFGQTEEQMVEDVFQEQDRLKIIGLISRMDQAGTAAPIRRLVEPLVVTDAQFELIPPKE